MGLLDFNISEIASRLVRGAAVRGRIRPTLDDGIVPTARVVDYTTAPYRLDELKYFQGIPASPLGAADGTVVALLNKSPLPIVLENWTAMRWSGGAMNVRMTMATRAVVDALGGINDRAFTSYELAPLPSTIRNDLVMRGALSVGGAFPVVGNYVDQFECNGATRYMSPWGLDLVIPPATALVWSASAVNTQISVFCQIRVINNVAIQP